MYGPAYSGLAFVLAVAFPRQKYKLARAGGYLTLP
jgi:hypothetical protein